MTANTVYEVFLALSPEEREKFIVLVKGQEEKPKYDFRKKRRKKVKFTKEDAIEYLLATVFKPKN
ncbi:hypothetical protein SAMN05444377_10879 [Flavobacterium fontis]|jgi:hypothetical protein|uniref:Uncharacterized protein n=1 Tax=Flavobacterium fontis TaxID=1124188 RepID=A0A1M5BGG8_9FLAO|nr:hypothetical protein [Flavobacterium fontis]SHF41545.1 hypothetical protein SAMN05444377_10879 [Flavobacterium fontis]